MMAVSDQDNPEDDAKPISDGRNRTPGLRSLALFALLLLCSSVQAQTTDPNILFYEPDSPQATAKAHVATSSAAP